MHERNFFTEKGWERDGAAALGITLSMFRFLLSFFSSVAVGAFFRWVPTVRGRHLYAILTGLMLIYYPFGNGVFNAFIPALITYALMLFVRPQCGRLAWLIDFSFLIVCHVGAASGAAWKEGKMDFTGCQMIVTLKLISSAVTYQDGLKEEKSLTEYQQAHKIRRLPSLLEYLSYIFAAGNLLAGPTFELSDYLDYVERKGPWDPRAPHPMPSPARAGALRFLKALVCMGTHLYLVSKLPVDILEEKWFHGLWLPYKMAVIWLVGFIYRAKYYFAWTVSEAALILSGFCFNGFDAGGQPRWDRYSNARIGQVELSTSLAELPAHWNICTGNFLRQYVYARLSPKAGRPPFYVLLATQLVSAVWHGLFPGYIMFFSTSAFMFEASKVIFRYERALDPQHKVTKFFPWVLIKWMFTAFTLNYAAVTFLLLEFKPGLRVWQSVYFIGHITIVALMLIGTVAPPPHASGRSKAGPAAESKSLPGVSELGKNGRGQKKEG